MKKFIVGSFTLFFSINLYAGFNGVTHHSRANCVNNESISWDWTKNWWFWVKSQHLDSASGRVIHTAATGWVKTWRAGVVDWGEGRGGWKVKGWHWMLGNNGQAILMAQETVSNCAIYDGWWDKNK